MSAFEFFHDIMCSEERESLVEDLGMEERFHPEGIPYEPGEDNHIVFVEDPIHNSLASPFWLENRQNTWESGLHSIKHPCVDEIGADSGSGHFAIEVGKFLPEAFVEANRC